MFAENRWSIGLVSVIIILAARVSPAVAAPEACCFDPTGCLNIEPASCSSLNGVSRGPGSTCAGVDCSSSGSCCAAGGGCSNGLSGFICTDGGGTYHGNGTSCQLAESTCNDGIDNDCFNGPDCFDFHCQSAPECMGACCLGGCSETTQFGCPFALYQGNGTTCEGSETFCNDGVDTDCDGNVDCADTDCASEPECLGACCVTAGGCANLLQEDCDVVPNSGWAGAFTTCGGSFPQENTLQTCCDGLDNDCDGLTASGDAGCPAFTCAPNDDCADAILSAQCANQFPDPNLGVCSVSAGPPNIFEVCDMTLGTPPRHDCVNPAAICQPPAFSDIYRCQFSTDNRGSTTDGPNTLGTDCFTSGANSFQRDIWYRYVAPCNGSMKVHNCGPGNTYDSMLQVFSNNTANCTSCPMTNNASNQACSNDNCGTGGGSAIRTPVINGACYTIRMGGWSPNGTVAGADTGISGLDIGVVCDPVFTGNPPTTAPVPHDRRKNRYLSFAPNQGLFSSVAFRVRKIALPMGSGFCVGTGATGAPCTGAPAQGTCGAGQLCVAPHLNGSPGGSCWVQSPVQTGADQYTATCGAFPVFRVWTEPVIHVGDCETIPVAEYAIYTNLPGPIENPTPLTVGTILLPYLNSKLWCDTVGSFTGSQWTSPNQISNINDILAILARISNALNRPEFVVANLGSTSSADSCLTPQVNAADVLTCVQAVGGASYGPPSSGKFVDPAQCAMPPSGACPCCGN